MISWKTIGNPPPILIVPSKNLTRGNALQATPTLILEYPFRVALRYTQITSLDVPTLDCDLDQSQRRIQQVVLD